MIAEESTGRDGSAPEDWLLNSSDVGLANRLKSRDGQQSGITRATSDESDGAGNEVCGVDH